MQNQLFLITDEKLKKYCKAAVMIYQGNHTADDLAALERKFALNDDKMSTVYRAVREIKERG